MVPDFSNNYFVNNFVSVFEYVKLNGPLSAIILLKRLLDSSINGNNEIDDVLEDSPIKVTFSGSLPKFLYYYKSILNHKSYPIILNY